MNDGGLNSSMKSDFASSWHIAQILVFLRLS